MRSKNALQVSWLCIYLHPVAFLHLEHLQPLLGLVTGYTEYPALAEAIFSWLGELCSSCSSKPQHFWVILLCHPPGICSCTAEVTCGCLWGLAHLFLRIQQSRLQDSETQIWLGETIDLECRHFAVHKMNKRRSRVSQFYCVLFNLLYGTER